VTSRPRSEVLGINRRNLEFVFAEVRPGGFEDLDDKVRTKRRLAEASVPSPETLGIVRAAADLPVLHDLLAGDRDLVLKPARGFGGKGILVLRRTEEGWVRPGGRPIGVSGIEQRTLEILSGVYSLDESPDHCLVEERIEPHGFFTGLYPHGLADLRVVVHDGVPVQAMCRIPTDRSEAKANLHAGAVGVGVDLADGRLIGGIRGGRRIDRHPDTGAPLDQGHIPDWDACRGSAVAAARAMGLRYVGVDIVLDSRRGPLVLEVNARPGLSIQLANDTGQPVPGTVPAGLGERVARHLGWWILVGLFASPWWLGPRWYQPEETLQLQVTDARDAVEVEDTERGLTWGREEIDVSAVDPRFRRARLAWADGDTAAAIDAYEAVAEDPALAPFAWNNLALIHRRRGDSGRALSLLDRALESFPEYARGLYNRSLVHEERDDPERALADVDRAIALRPSYAHAWERKGDLHFDARDFVAAEAAYRQAIRFDPDETGARLRLGLSLRLQDRITEATSELAALLELRPDHEAGAYWWARSRMESPGTPAPPDSLLERLGPHLTGPDRSPRCLSLAIDAWWRKGSWWRAERGLRDLVALGYQRSSHRGRLAIARVELGRTEESPDAPWPEDPTAAPRPAARWLDWLADPAGPVPSFSGPWRSLATAIESAEPSSPRGEPLFDAVRAWIATGDSTRIPDLEALALAAVATRRLDDDRPGPSLLLWTLARIADRRGAPRVSEAARRILARHLPSFWPARRARFFAYVEDDNRSSALRAGRALLRMVPNDPEVRLALVRVELDGGDPVRARAEFEGLEDNAKKSVEAGLVEARLLAAEGEKGSALDQLKRLAERAPGDVRIPILRARWEMEAGRPGRAARAWSEALRMAPERVDLRRGLARALDDADRHDEAAEEWRRVLRLGADTSSDRFRLALSLQRAGHLDEAIREWSALLEADPERTSARFNRGLAFERLGRMEQARADFLAVLEIRPEHESSRRHLQQIGDPP